MRLNTLVVGLALCGAVAWSTACYRVGSTEAIEGTDDDTDSDSDSDGDTDSDTDGDSDTDSDTDTDGDSDSDSDSDSDVDTNPTDDNDGDGLSNGFEEEIGTDPNNPDTDGDGVSDLVEWVAGTDPTDPSSNPKAEGNFYFFEPFGEPPDPFEDTLVFATDIQMADVFMLTDTTDGMSGEIDNLQASLSSTIIPGIEAIIPDAWFGVGYFDDYPYGSYGGSPDVPFGLLQAMTSDAAAVQTAVNAMPENDGGDWAESDVPALFAIATGSGLGTYLPEQTSCPDDHIGYPCFRPGAVPIIVLITDAPFHNGPSGYDAYSGISPVPPDYATTVTALNDIHATVLSISTSGATTGDIAYEHAQAIASDTGAVTDTGPLTIAASSDGSGLGTDVVDAVALLAYGVPMDMSVVARDDTSDDVDATVFIDRIVPNIVGGIADPVDPTLVCVGGLATADTDSDSYQDTFIDVLPGTPVCFDIIPAQNDSVPQSTMPAIYKAFIDVIGDRVTVLDTREVFFLVPPEGIIE